VLLTREVVFEAAKRKWMTVLKVVRNADRSIPKHNHNRKCVLSLPLLFFALLALVVVSNLDGMENG
jgi:hypothetical protein